MAVKRLSNEVLTMTLKINGDQSRQDLHQLGKEANELRKQMNKAAKDATRDYDALERELEKVDKLLRNKAKLEKMDAAEVDKLRESQAKLNLELKKIEDASSQFVYLQRELAHTEKKMDDVRKGIDITTMSQEELRRETYRLRMELEKADPKSEIYQQFETQLKQVTDRTKQLRNGWQQLKGEYNLAGQSIAELNKRMGMLDDELKSLNPEKYAARIEEIKNEKKKLYDRVNELNFALNKLEDTFDITSASIEKMEQRQKTLNVALKRMDPNDERIKAYRNELAALDKRIKQVSTGAGTFRQSWDNFAQKANEYQTALAGIGLTIYAIVNTTQQWLNANAELSDSIADVQKTTGFTKAEVKDLMQTFKSFNTRTPQKELLELARIAGKLGIKGQADIAAFVREADKINVALSADLGGDVEETVRQLGKLTETFKIKEIYGQAEALNKVGSAINALGANSTANEGFMVEFTKRIAGVAPTAKLNIQNVLGLSSALDQLGQTAEVSGTVFSQVLPDMFKNTAEYAKVAGMNTEDFGKLLDTDVNEALIKVLEGLKGNNDGLRGMAQRLDTLGVDGQRSISVLGVLANNTELLRKEQALANDEFEKGTSLANEFAVKNETLAGDLSKVSRALHSMFVNSAVVKGMEKFVGLLADMTEMPVSESLERQRMETNLLANSIMAAGNNQALRNSLIAEMQSKYPDFLKNLDTEKVTNKELAERLTEVNTAFTEKIKLAALQEQTEATLKSATAKQIEINKNFDGIMKMYTDALEEYGIIKAIDPDDMQDINKVADAVRSAYGKRVTNKEGVSLVPFGEIEMNDLDNYLQWYKDTQEEIKKIQEEYDRLSNQLAGIVKNTPMPVAPAADAGTDAGSAVFVAPAASGDKWVKPDFDFESPQDPDIPFNYDYNPYAEKDDFWSGTTGGMFDAQGAMENDQKLKSQKELEVLEDQKRQEAYTQWLKEEQRKRVQMYMDMYQELLGFMDIWVEGQRQKYGEDSKEYKRALKAKVMAQLAADLASSILSLTAVAEANPLNAVTFGSAGMAQWAQGIIRIGANIAQARNALNAINAEQAYMGRYNVRGAQDGRLYKNVPAKGTQTGYYGRPTLISEHGNEAVFAAHDLKKPFVYRHVSAAIRGIGTNQRADGKYDVTQAEEVNAAMLAMLDTLIKETRANRPQPVSWYDTQKALRKLEDLQNRTRVQ